MQHTYSHNSKVQTNSILKTYLIHTTLRTDFVPAICVVLLPLLQLTKSRCHHKIYVEPPWINNIKFSQNLNQSRATNRERIRKTPIATNGGFYHRRCSVNVMRHATNIHEFATENNCKADVLTV